MFEDFEASVQDKKWQITQTDFGTIKL